MESILCRKVFNISGEILSSLVKTLLLHSSSGESLGDTSWQSIGHKRVGQIFTCYFPVKNINSFFDRLCGLKRALFSWCFNPKGIFSVEIWICWPDNALALISIWFTSLLSQLHSTLSTIASVWRSRRSWVASPARSPRSSARTRPRREKSRSENSRPIWRPPTKASNRPKTKKRNSGIFFGQDDSCFFAWKSNDRFLSVLKLWLESSGPSSLG